VSLATNRCDDRKLNRKVNTVNALLHEFVEDTSVDTQFVLCENNNLSTANSEIRNRFITTDGYLPLFSTKPTMSKLLIQFKNETSLSSSKSFETKPLTFHTPIQNNRAKRKFGGISVLIRKSLPDDVEPLPVTNSSIV
jgi:hypothetical protein